MNKQVSIFIDGSCLGNPGPGGYGIILSYKTHKKTFSAGYYLTTNNRMELMAAIVALKTLIGTCNVVLNTDSKYVYQGITKWIYDWKKHDWKTAKKKLIKNIDLWRLLDTATRPHVLCWNWIKGHIGYPENEICDELARTAACYPTLYDTGYLAEIKI